MKKNKKKISSLFTQQPESTKFPNTNIYPINWKYSKKDNESVFPHINKEIRNTKEFLAITGFTSISYIIDFIVDEVKIEDINSLKILFGFDISVSRRTSYMNEYKLNEKLKSELITKGHSIIGNGKIFEVLELLENEDNKIEFRRLDKCHAKIYISDNSAMIGSSNMSLQGLGISKNVTQIEANIVHNLETEKEHYENLKLLANSIYKEGKEANKSIIEILNSLVLYASWEEVLARACVEILEKEMEVFSDLKERIDKMKLWPSQIQAINEAMNVLRENGSVIVAEPTGSGKTRLISVIQALYKVYIRTAIDFFLTQTAVICPKSVIENWSKERLEIGEMGEGNYSIGLLSNDKKGKTKRKIKNAQLIIIDEAHNFLNKQTNRTKAIEQSEARARILSTATPINKKVSDLVDMIRLVGIDNLTKEQFSSYKELYENRRNLPESDYEKLKSFIKPFMVRRTKSQLRQMIKAEPSKYKNDEGKQCEYPLLEDKTYNVDASLEDEKIGLQIENLCKELRGVLILENLQIPKQYPHEPYQYVEIMSKAAKGLAYYNVLASMRSSKAALLEFLYGANYVYQHFSWKESQKEGKGKEGIINKLNNMVNSGLNVSYDKKVIEVIKKLDNLFWIIDLEQKKKIFEEEISIYNKILNLAEKLSTEREQQKIDKLTSLSKNHDIVLAFDDYNITLHYLKWQSAIQNDNILYKVVTGSTRNKQEITTLAGRNSKMKNLVIFCSDVVSEGVNLQGSSCVVFMNIPSVLRLIEQRIGRIERLDSSHHKVEIYWPLEKAPFLLKSKEKFYKTYQGAKKTIGVNFKILEQCFGNYDAEYISTEEIMSDEIEKRKKIEQDDSVVSTFHFVHNLIGKQKLISKEIYDRVKEDYANQQEASKCFVSGVETGEEWVFVCFKATKERPAKWVFIDSDKSVCVKLDEICKKLMDKLYKKNKKPIQQWNKKINQTLNKFKREITNLDRSVLSVKESNSINMFEEILNYIIIKNVNKECKEIANRLKKVLKIEQLTEGMDIMDYGKVANYLYEKHFLRILNPQREEKYQGRKVYHLTDLLNTTFKQNTINYFTIEKLNEIYEKIDEFSKTPISHQAIAYIVGLPYTENSEI